MWILWVDSCAGLVTQVTLVGLLSECDRVWILWVDSCAGLVTQVALVGLPSECDRVWILKVDSCVGLAAQVTVEGPLLSVHQHARLQTVRMSKPGRALERFATSTAVAPHVLLKSRVGTERCGAHLTCALFPSLAHSSCRVSMCGGT